MKNAENSRRYIYKITPISVDNCSRVAKIVSEYDQEIPQSQTADKPTVPRGRATQ